MSTSSEPKLLYTFSPLPTTRRGYGIQINVHPKDQRLAYTNGKLVILRSLTNPADSLVFTEHKCNVNVAAFSPSGFWVASGDEEGNVIVWSYPGLKVKSQFKIGKTVLDLDWDESSTRIIAAGDGQFKAKVFSWDSGNNLGELQMHSQQVISCSYRKHRPFRVVTASEDLTVNIYEGPPFKYSNSYKGHSRYPNCVRYSPDGEYYLTVGADQKIVLFKGATGEVVKEIENKEQGHTGAIYSFAWAPDSKQILTVSADKTAKIWSIEDGSVQKSFSFGKDILDMQVGAVWTNEYLITVSLSGAINYLDINNPAKPKQIIQGHQSSITSIVLDRLNNKFYTSGLTGEVTEWDFKTGAAKWFNGKGHGGKVVQCLTLNKDATQLYSYGLDDKVRVNEVKSLEFNSSAQELSGMPVAAAASPTDNSLAVAILAQEKLVVLKNGEVVQTVPLGYNPTAVAFNHNGTKLLIGGKNKQVQLFNVNQYSEANDSIIKSHDKPVTAVVASADGALYASVDTEKSIYIHTSNGLELKNKSGWRFHNAGVLDVDFSPDSAKLVTGSIDCAVIVWNDLKEFNGSSRTKIANAHAADVTATRFWDDNTIISVSQDKTIKIWKL